MRCAWPGGWCLARTAASRCLTSGTVSGIMPGSGGGAWSSGYSVLVADYFWMYADGWGGSTSNTPNTACTSPGASGCWAHRDELLGADPSYNPGVGLGCTTCVMGTGYAVVNGASSFADLIELPKGAVDLTFTWAGDVQPYL